MIGICNEYQVKASENFDKSKLKELSIYWSCRRGKPEDAILRQQGSTAKQSKAFVSRLEQFLIQNKKNPTMEEIHKLVSNA